jgi:hypothetical protein
LSVAIAATIDVGTKIESLPAARHIEMDRERLELFFDVGAKRQGRIRIGDSVVDVVLQSGVELPVLAPAMTETEGEVMFGDRRKQRAERFRGYRISAVVVARSDKRSGAEVMN